MKSSFVHRKQGLFLFEKKKGVSKDRRAEASGEQKFLREGYKGLHRAQNDLLSFLDTTLL